MIAVARDIVKGVTVVALSHVIRSGDRAAYAAAGPDPDDPDGAGTGPAGAAATGAHRAHRGVDESEAGVAALGVARHPAVERQVRARCREPDVLEGEPAQDERHQLQRHHGEADERHERDQADARPRERRDERRADDQREDDQEHARQRGCFHAHESPDRAKRIGKPDVVGGHRNLSQQIDQVDERDPEDQHRRWRPRRSRSIR